MDTQERDGVDERMLRRSDGTGMGEFQMNEVIFVQLERARSHRSSNRSCGGCMNGTTTYGVSEPTV